MSDSAHPRRPSPARPKPARAEEPTRETKQARERREEREEDAAPTPARALLAETDEDEVTEAPQAAEATLEADGDTWTVRVIGRSRTGAAYGPASLLLLAFFREGADRPERECLTVGAALEDLSDEALRRALELGRPPADPGTHKEIFPEVGGRKRNRDG